MAHDEDVGIGQRVGEEVAGLEAEAVTEPEGGDVLLEDRTDDRQVEAAAAEMAVRQGDLHGEAALGGADVDERPVLLPGELLRHRSCRAEADARHGLEEEAQARGVRVESGEEVASAELGLVLRLAGAERLGEGAPEPVEPDVQHLEQAAHVGGLRAVEEEVGLRGVRVALAVADEHAERDERVEEVPRAPRVEAEPTTERLAVERALRELGEDAELDGAEEGLRAPEGAAEVDDTIGRKVAHGAPLTSRGISLAIGSSSR